MLNHQGNQDFVPIDRLVSESCTSHLPQIVEPVSVQKFLDRIMQYQVDPAQVGRQICQIIATNSDREILLLQIANTLGVAFQAEGCFVTAVTDNQVAIPHAWWQSKSDGANSSDIVADLTKTSEFCQTTILNSPLISPVLAQVLADGEVAAISDIQDCPATNLPNSLTTPLPFRAILVAPVRFGAAINGMIMVGKSQPYEWSETDRQQLEAVSDSIAIAISQIHKTQEITTLNQHLQQQAKYQNLLRKVASSIDTSSELDLILQRIIENTADTLEVDRGQILLLRYTDPLFQTRSPNQTPRARVELVCETPLRRRSTARTKNQFWISESSLCDRAFNSVPQSLALADTGEFIRKEPLKVTEILNLEGTRSLLMLPLLGASGQGTVLGFLVLQHSKPRTWELEELEVVESVAAQITTAIIQTQTLKQIQALVEDRTSQLQRSLDMQATLYKQTLRQVEQLRRLNQLKDEFVATMSDALRNPLTSMTVAIQMLKTANLTPKHLSYLEILETECIRETTLINDLLELQELESQQTSFPVAEINLDSLIHNAVEEFDRKLADNRKLADKKLTWKVNLPKPIPLLETHPESLKRILIELLTNAGKFSAAGTAVVVEVSQTAAHIVLSVSNIGRGISAEDLPYIFDKFRRGTGVTEKGIAGTGLGLALVKCLVQHLNGTIDVSSSPSKNNVSRNPSKAAETVELWCTCFTLTLPQFPEEISNLEA